MSEIQTHKRKSLEFGYSNLNLGLEFAYWNLGFLTLVIPKELKEQSGSDTSSPGS
jgi:hypothetical protein